MRDTQKAVFILNDGLCFINFTNSDDSGACIFDVAWTKDQWHEKSKFKRISKTCCLNPRILHRYEYHQNELIYFWYRIDSHFGLCWPISVSVSGLCLFQWIFQQTTNLSVCGFLRALDSRSLGARAGDACIGLEISSDAVGMWRVNGLQQGQVTVFSSFRTFDFVPLWNVSCRFRPLKLSQSIKDHNWFL